jgi:hypothetical protein
MPKGEETASTPDVGVGSELCVETAKPFRKFGSELALEFTCACGQVHPVPLKLTPASGVASDPNPSSTGVAWKASGSSEDVWLIITSAVPNGSGGSSAKGVVSLREPSTVAEAGSAPKPASEDAQPLMVHQALCNKRRWRCSEFVGSKVRCGRKLVGDLCM